MLNLKESVTQLDRQIRALTPWPGTSVLLNIEGKTRRLKILSARPDTNLTHQPGKLFEKAGMLCLGASDGALVLEQLQGEGKAAVDVHSFVNGLKGRNLSLPLEVSL